MTQEEFIKIVKEESIIAKDKLKAAGDQWSKTRSNKDLKALKWERKIRRGKMKLTI